MWIYEMVNVKTEKTYIGQTIKRPSVRFAEHINQLNRGTHHNKYLQSDWNVYGNDVFFFRVITERVKH